MYALYLQRTKGHKKKKKKIHRRATFSPFPSYAHCITTAEAAAHV